MSSNSASEQTGNLANQAAQSADHAIRSTQRMANEALDGLATTVEGLRHQAAPMLSNAADQAEALTHRSMDALHDGSRQLRVAAQNMSNGTASYIKDEPIKAMLIAAASGAVLMALLSLMRGPHRPR